MRKECDFELNEVKIMKGKNKGAIIHDTHKTTRKQESDNNDSRRGSKHQSWNCLRICPSMVSRNPIRTPRDQLNRIISSPKQSFSCTSTTPTLLVSENHSLHCDTYYQHSYLKKTKIEFNAPVVHQNSSGHAQTTPHFPPKPQIKSVNPATRPA